MGKNITIYFDDESLRYIDEIEGKGTLINQLVKDHFSDQLDIMKCRLEALKLDIGALSDRIKNKEVEMSLKNNKNKEITENKVNKIEEQDKKDREHIRKFITKALPLLAKVPKNANEFIELYVKKYPNQASEVRDIRIFTEFNKLQKEKSEQKAVEK